MCVFPHLLQQTHNFEAADVTYMSPKHLKLKFKFSILLLFNRLQVNSQNIALSTFLHIQDT